MYEQQRKQFEGETSEHVITIIKDDGLYRHIRLGRPGNGSIWSWQLITWPGYLTIVGDIGDGWTFSRLEDMFEFFESSSGDINPSYWWEKMPHQLRTAAKHHSSDLLRLRAIEAIRDWELLPADNTKAVMQFQREWAMCYGDENEERIAVNDFVYKDTDGFEGRFYDTWEWDTQEWDHHFLLALFAIVFGIKKYREEKAT